MPYADVDVDCSSCYVMGVLVDAETRRALRSRTLDDGHGVQTSVYPAIHQFTAYREAYGDAVAAADRARRRRADHDPALPAHDRRAAGPRRRPGSVESIGAVAA